MFCFAFIYHYAYINQKMGLLDEMMVLLNKGCHSIDKNYILHNELLKKYFFINLSILFTVNY